ncbi:MAG: glycosyltransferase [Proteobacteria bacterium]|nr:glycosyltransferase [Pseudomonadota bacterium]
MKSTLSNLKSTPKVSVIIPTYNSAQYIAEAIESVLNQTYKNIEIIVVDDGSTDHTKEKLKYFINNKQILYLYQQNRGASSARNVGIQKARSKYIGFLDADDKFQPQMIEYCLRELINNNNDLVSVDIYLTYLSGEKEINREIQSYDWIEREPQELFLKFLEVGAIGGPHKALFKKDVFDKVGLFDTSLPVYEDLDMWIRIAIHGFKWSHIRQPLVTYYKGIQGSLFTKNPELNQDCRLKVLRRYRREAIRKCPAIKNVFAKQLWDFGRSYALNYNSYGKSAMCFLDSIVTKPSLSRIFSSTNNFLKTIIQRYSS